MFSSCKFSHLRNRTPNTSFFFFPKSVKGKEGEVVKSVNVISESRMNSPHGSGTAIKDFNLLRLARERPAATPLASPCPSSALSELTHCDGRYPTRSHQQPAMCKINTASCHNSINKEKKSSNKMPSYE